MIPVLAAMALGLAEGGEPPVKKGPEVSEGHHDTSRPLREIPPAKRKPGRKIHRVKPLPRPKPLDETK